MTQDFEFDFDDTGSGKEEVIFEKEVLFELCYVDFDTPIYQAAAGVQENFIEVTHIKSGKKKEFSGVKAFRGLKKSWDGGWIGEVNEKRALEDKPPITHDMFSIEECARLDERFETEEEAVEEAMKMVDIWVGKVKKYCQAHDYVLVVGGSGHNYRYDYDFIQKYKGERKAKPMLHEDVVKAFHEKYGHKTIVADEGEADDYVSHKGYESFKHHNKTGRWKWSIAFCDKDLKMIPCPYINTYKFEDGYTYTTPYDSVFHLCTQLLTGDKTDNILGLPNLTLDVQTKYKLRKTRGVGAASAKALLDGSKDPKELLTRVVEAYQGYYGMEPFKFDSWKEGAPKTRTWLDMMRENAILLFMQRFEGERYDIEETLKKYKIPYQERLIPLEEQDNG